MPGCLREEMEGREAEILSPHAALARASQGRLREEPECPLRTAFQRDRDRIIHSKTFRRLKHKTQVFLAPTGDHYRTRLTHALEVSQIARTIAAALRLNLDLTEAIALGHDLGHTPFGHSGEKVLDDIHPEGFHHYEQSIRVVDILEKKGRGLNLTREVRDGILRHSKGRRRILPEDTSELPETLEGQVVRVADIVAYVNHDLDDALRAGVVRDDEIPGTIPAVIGTTHAARIGAMVQDLVLKTREAGGGRLVMSPAVERAITDLRAFLYERVYESDTVHGDFIKAMKVMRELYYYFLANPGACDQDIEYPEDTPDHRRVCDFIAGMTDRYALDRYTAIFLPKPWSVL